MKTKMVPRYECDFCGKKKYSRAAMKLHELHCTMNPDRKCRMCNYTEGGASLAELKALLIPFLKSKTETSEFDSTCRVSSFTDEQLAELRAELYDAADGCPNCILAAIRQSGLVSYELGWDYKIAINDFWSNRNDYEDDASYL
jgi:hypothetical protein